MVAVGDIWEGHELVSELEHGMVHTFLARQVGDARSWVWLHLREGSRVEREVFADELQRLQQIAAQVPQIDRVLYGGVRDSVAWVASPFHANAIRLKQATRGAELGLTALQIAIELGEYLLQGNNRGWVHGSMSPEHVLITQHGGYLVTHFGFVRLFEIGEEEAGRDPRYAAPELLFGKRPISKRTDVYGLGTILYELACRRELYADDGNLAYCALTWDPALPLVVPASVRRVISKALAKGPQDRYPNVEHLLQELHALAEDWNKPEVLEQPPDTLRSSTAAAEGAPGLAPAPPPPPETLETLPVVSTTQHEGMEAAPVSELGTLEPPSPRVYYEEPPIEPSASTSSRSILAPEASRSPEHPRGTPPRPRSGRAALVGAFASLALLAAVVLLRWERPAARTVATARLGRVVQVAAARHPRPSDAEPAPPLAVPPMEPPAATPIFATRRATAARQVAEPRPMAAPSSDSECDGPYACIDTLRY